LKEQEHQRLVAEQKLRDHESQLRENSSLPVAPEAVVNERKIKGDARNASICGKQENNGPASGQNVGRERSLPGDHESRLKKTCTSTRAVAAAHEVSGPSSGINRQEQGQRMGQVD